MEGVRNIFEKTGADAMLTEAADLRKYLTGFQSTFGYVYTDSTENIFFTDPRYAEMAEAFLKDSPFHVRIVRSEKEVLAYVKEKKSVSLAVPLERISVPEFTRLRENGFTLVDSMPYLKESMIIKSPYELGCIAKACEIAEDALLSVMGQLREGMTENETAALVEYEMRMHGAEDRSFETIAAFGKNSSVPHHHPDSTALKKGMLVLIDFGCLYHGYCSDCTRTFFFGKGSDYDEIAKAYDAVYGAHMAAAENIREGITGKEADAIARNYLAERGLDRYFSHSLGHGIGVNIHEDPVLSPSGDTVLCDGMVFSDEPGVYFAGKFGIRIEDSVTIKGGRVETFMKKTDKKLLVL